VLSVLGCPVSEEFQRILKEVDLDRDGNICFREFILWLFRPTNALGPGSHVARCQESFLEYERIFHLFDSDNSGFLDRSELEPVLEILLASDPSMTSVGGKACKLVDLVLSEFDVDGDGLI
ncbi:unnamed protein product, partial [Polarella glacialis]